MGATAAIVGAVVAAGATTYGAINANQQAQHAKGAAQAEATAAQNQVDQQAAQDKATQQSKADSASATQAAAIQALRASLSASSGFGGSLLTNPSVGTGGQTIAPTQTKTLLGT